MNRIYTSILVVVIGLLTMNTQCDKEDAPPKLKHWFKEKATLTPYQTTYHTGDTIYLNVFIPDKKMYDTITNKIIRYDSIGFSSEASVHLVYNNPLLTTGPFASFVFPDNVVGSVYNNAGYTSAAITFGCSPSNDYSLTLGIVLIEKGVFELSFAVPYPYLSKCFTNSLDYDSGIGFIFDVNDTHLSLYNQLPLDSIGVAADGAVTGRLESKTSVIIKVE